MAVYEEEYEDEFENESNGSEQQFLHSFSQEKDIHAKEKKDIIIDNNLVLEKDKVHLNEPSQMKLQEQAIAIQELERVNASLRTQMTTTGKMQTTTQRKTTVRKSGEHTSVRTLKKKQNLMLKKKNADFKKEIADLKTKLVKVYNTSTFSKLENAAREKQARIEELQEENRTLENVQRHQNKRIDEQEHENENMPEKMLYLLEELRICKEKNRCFKEREKNTQAKSSSAHQKIVDLTATNQKLMATLATHDSSKSANTTQQDTLTRQNENIDKLKTRIALLEKTKRLEKNRYEKLLRLSSNEMTNCTREMESYHTLFINKEKEIRSEVLEVKKLKRNLNELMTQQDNNHDIYHFLQRNITLFETRNNPIQKGIKPSNIPHQAFGSTSPNKSSRMYRHGDTVSFNTNNNHHQRLPTVNTSPKKDSNIPTSNASPSTDKSSLLNQSRNMLPSKPTGTKGHVRPSIAKSKVDNDSTMQDHSEPSLSSQQPHLSLASKTTIETTTTTSSTEENNQVISSKAQEEEEYATDEFDN